MSRHSVGTIPPALKMNGEVKTAGVRLEVIECWVRRGAIAAIVCAACLAAIAAVQVGESIRSARARAALGDSMQKMRRDMSKAFAPPAKGRFIP